MASHPSPGARLALALRHAPAHVGLALPDFSSEIPGKFDVSMSQTSGLIDAAVTLAELGVLRPEHWQGKPSEAISTAFTDLAKLHLPKPLASWSLQFVDDTTKDGDSLNFSEGCGSTDNSSYQTFNKIPAAAQVGAIILTFDNNASVMVHRVIGPTILRLEKCRAGLGQTVLYWLHSAFSGSCRALDPVEGVDWCSNCYWRGEVDESERLAEEMDEAKSYYEGQQDKLPEKDRKPFDPVAEEKALAIFRKADYDRVIPPWAGTAFKHKPALSLRELEKYVSLATNRKFATILIATLNAARVLERTAKTDFHHYNDAGYFEKCRQEISPYIIRWKCDKAFKKQDPLGQVYDDIMNDYMQSGEELTDVNAVFAFHDATSLGHAVKRFTIYLQRVRAADALLNAVTSLIL